MDWWRGLSQASLTTGLVEGEEEAEAEACHCQGHRPHLDAMQIVICRLGGSKQKPGSGSGLGFKLELLTLQGST